MRIINTIKDYKKIHKKIPNLQTLSEILGLPHYTVRYEISKAIAEGKLKKVERYQEGHFDLAGDNSKK